MEDIVLYLIEQSWNCPIFVQYFILKNPIFPIFPSHSMVGALELESRLQTPIPLYNIEKLGNLCPGIYLFCPWKRTISFKCPGIVLEISTPMSWNFPKNVLECPGMSWNFDFRIVWPLCLIIKNSLGFWRFWWNSSDAKDSWKFKKVPKILMGFQDS